MTFNRHRLRGMILIGWFGAALLSGCGGSDVGRVGVSGTVTLDGQPLESGAILFLPKGAGPSAGTQIENGRFSIARGDGPSPGDYRVEIRSFRGTGRMVPDDDLPGQMVEFREQIIPARYNDASDLEATLSADRRREELTFDLQSN